MVLGGPSDCSSGADVYFSEFEVCWDCAAGQGNLWGFIGNSGPDAFAGPVVVLWEDESGISGSIEVSSGSLAPGATTGLFTIPFGLVVSLSLKIQGEDCNPDDNQYLYENPGGDMVCPF